MNHFPNATMLHACSGIIWIQNTYNLDVLQMAKGNLISATGNYQYTNKPNNTNSMHYEDLMYISHVAMQMDLYATAINFFAASIRMHKDRKCLFRIKTKQCMPYSFNNVKAWYISVHNYLLDLKETTYDSAVLYPYRIKSGWFDVISFFLICY